MVKNSFIAIILVIMVADQVAASNRLACFYFDENDPHGGSIFYKMLGPALPFEWAKSDDQQDRLFEGQERNAFFEIQGVSQEEAKISCVNTLKRLFPDKKIRLVSMAVKPSPWSITFIPAAFSEKHSKDLKKLVIVGDSLSDQGSIRDMLKIIPGPPYFAGRFSNGRIWVDYLQDVAGFSVLNLATAGSKTGPFLEVDFHSRKDWPKRWMDDVSSYLSGTLQDQITNYQRRLKGGAVDSATYILVWAGSNDYLAFLEDTKIADRFLDMPNHKLGYKNIIARSTNNIVQIIEQLYAMGARNFLIPSMPDLGKLPRLLDNKTYHSEQEATKRLILLSQKMTIISEQHNMLLLAKLEELKRSHRMNFTYIDIRGELKKMPPIMRAEVELNHGESSAVIGRSCYPNNYFSSLGFTSGMCENPEKLFFWDDVHPTTYGHCLFAAFIHEALAQKQLLPLVSLKTYLSMFAPSWLYEARVRETSANPSCRL